MVAMDCVRKGEAGAFVSAGSTGAASPRRRVPVRCRRSTVPASWRSNPNGPITILDVGANVHAKPNHLLQYGVMGELFARNVLGTTKPRVALLNIGEEEEKGTELVKSTRDLFTAAPFHFAGNIEGNDLLANRADVVVCEGFVGNVGEGVEGWATTSTTP
jgi:glycerol-3-phosphate acyltransferase PlsX